MCSPPGMTTVGWFVIPERENMRVSGIPFPLDGGRYDCMDAGGRAKQESEPRMGVENQRLEVM